MLSLIALDDTGRVNSIGGPEFGRNSGSISLMSSDDGQVTIAGMFTAVNGEARASLARLKPQPDFTLPHLEILTTLGEKQQLAISFTSPHMCRIDESSDLGNWRTLTNIIGTTSPLEIELAPTNKRFYRAIVP
jgi:hypothetical protein